MIRVLFFIITITFVISQSEDLTKAEKDFKKITSKIKKINSILKDLKEKQETEEIRLKKLDYTILLNTNTYNSLRTELKITKRNIKKQTVQKYRLEKEINVLRDTFEKRVIASYKIPKQNWIDIFFNAESVEQFFRIAKYNEIIHHEEQELSDKLLIAIRKRDELLESLRKERKRTQTLVAEQKKVLQSLKADEKEKKAYLQANKRDQKRYKKSLISYVKNRKRIENLMTKLYKLSKNKKVETSSNLASLSAYKALHTKFRKNKGRFPWPVKGKVIQGFGKNKIKMKGSKPIYIKNNGLDVQAKKGANVRSIHDGRVDVVAYEPGFGHYAIINHGDGYFSLYANLNDIYIAQDDVITRGDVIGGVGSSGTLDGTYKLHFEIWGNNKPLNPKKWLK